jgi:hypothetical protein
MATKTKTPPVFGDDLPITAFQIKRIRQNCNFQEEIKNEWVQWVTGDTAKTSLKCLTQAQAVRIIKQQQPDAATALKPVSTTKLATSDNWGLFDKENAQHKRIQANLRTAKIVTPDGWADMLGWLDRFLKSDKSPVKKPLKSMTPQEVSKIIVALDGVAVWKNSI